MEVSVITSDTGYIITLGDKTITLPLDSTDKEDRKRHVRILGTETMRLEISPRSNEIDLVKSKNDPGESVLSEDDADDEERERIVMELSNAWANRHKGDSDPEGGRRRRSRVNRKTRRSQRKRRHTKRR